MFKKKDRYSSKQMKELKYQRFHHPDPDVKQRVGIVYLYGKGLKILEIVLLEDVLESAVSTLIQTYEHGGLQALETSTLLVDVNRRETP